MRHALPLVGGAIALLAAACAAPAGGPAPSSSASPAVSQAASPSASSSPSAARAATPSGGAVASPGAPGVSAAPAGVATVVPGTSVAVPVTYKLTVDGQPGEMEPSASYHNAPGSSSSVFWDIGAFAKTPGMAPTGALKAGQFACAIHCAPVAFAPSYFSDVRSLTDTEFVQAIKFHLREGVARPGVPTPITREWYVDGRTPNANMTGSLTVVGGSVEFKLSATMPQDKYNGMARTITLEVTGLPRP